MTAQEALKTYWGYDDFRPLQAEIVESVLAGRDTLALLPTGGGKSICFQVPTMVMGGLCLVISPLIALMKDQVQNLRNRNIQAAAIYTGMSYEQQKTALDNCMWGPYHFLYVSPERLESEEFRERLAHLPICMIAVDEAHCISQWGYDFRPSYLKIAEIREVVQEFRSSGVKEFRSEGVPSEHLNSSSAASAPLNRGKASSAIRVIVATNAFGMGIDKPDVRVVIHHDLPDTIEAYFQEAGRAGRDEQKAFAVLLYDPSDKTKARKRVADNYPDEETLHNVYHKTCNYLGVGADSGQGATFFIDVFDLCKKMHLPVFPTYSALHLLSQMGYFGFDEEQEIHPRVRLRVSRRELEEYRLNEEENSLLEHLMREYTGIFTDLQYVHNLDEKHQELVALAQKRIIDYVPRTKANVLRLTVNRQAEIRIPHEFYNDRKNHYVSKLKAMVEYAENQHYCRSQVMLGYFGENDAPTCGTCDICRAHSKQ